MTLKEFKENVKDSSTQLLLNAWIHNRKLTEKQREIVEKELIERGAVLK